MEPTRENESVAIVLRNFLLPLLGVHLLGAFLFGFMLDEPQNARQAERYDCVKAKMFTHFLWERQILDGVLDTEPAKTAIYQEMMEC